ncbi:MAG: DNA-binding protein WhiA [Lachnospiraceae bacterium]|nr:DNA-binding protein WhiA [Lachnospiraceae bacterium]
MSFSGQVKAELYKVLPRSRHCQIAEIAAIISFLGKLRKKTEKNTISLETENADISQKCFTLLKKTISMDWYGVSGFADLESEELIDMLKISGDELYPVDERIIQQPCCKASFLRGAFLAAGSVSDPSKAYHFEIVCRSEKQAKQLVRIFNSFELPAKVVVRKDRSVVYLKEGSHVADALGYMGAPKSLMDLENIRILKDMRNDLNRKVNCETANISKTVSAAYRQLEDIKLLEEKGVLKELPVNLKEAAQLRIDNPDLSLGELAELCDPPVGKSGMNHRFRKLALEADKLRN